MANKKSQRMSFQWNYSEGGIVQRLGFGKDLNKYFAKTLLEYAEPYTPYKSGKLFESARVRANNSVGRIEYEGIDYADYQYLSDDTGWDRHTPGTTSRWLDVAFQNHKQEIAGKVGAYRRWHSN